MKVERFSFIEFSDGVIATAGRRMAAKPKEEAPPPPPAFSEAELKAAERAAYQKGFLEGEKEGRKQAESAQAMVDRKLAELVEKFAGRIAPLFDDYKKNALSVRERMPKIALAIARKVAGAALGQNAQAAVEDTALRACETLMKEPKLTITIHESLGDTLAKKIEQLAERLQSAADIVILRDPNMPIEDFRIEWNQGGMERQTAQIWQQVEKMIEDMSLAETRDANEEMAHVQAQVTKEG